MKRPSEKELAAFQRKNRRRLGTGAQAIAYAIDHEDDHYDRLNFLKAWQDGSLADDNTEWPEYQTWLRGQRKKAA
jgi:hypothetical protein